MIRPFVFVLAFFQLLSSAEAKRYLIQFHENPTSVQYNQTWIMSKKNKLESILGFQLSDAKLLWIADGYAANLTEVQYEKVQAVPDVKNIIALNRTAKLIHQDFPSKNALNSLRDLTPADQSEIKEDKFTWGLKMIKKPEAMARFPELTGEGIGVGIIDTGLDPQHPDLRNKLKAFKDFTNKNNVRPLDDHGHGTHVAGTIAGENKSGQWIGLASRSHLFIAKGFNSRGSSTDEGLLAALQWMADPDQDPTTNDQPKLISNSWNIDDSHTENLDPAKEPFCLAIDQLKNLGITSVFAAGNDGPDDSTILVPGACPNALTVGATNFRDRLANFSSRGPVRWQQLILSKPDISAPGESIDSADPGGGYKTRSGTSMATPHVAGALALMFQMNADLTPDAAKDILLSSTDDLGNPGFDYLFGVGRLNVLSALERTPKKTNSIIF